MPVFRDRRLEDDKNQGPGLKLSSGSDQSALAQAGQPQSQPKDTGSNFQNLDKYLSANDAKGFGQQVGGKVQGEINQSKQTIDDTFGEVKNQINQSGVIPTNEQISSAVAKPESADASQYQSWINQTYQGPKSLQDNQAAASKVGGAVSNAQQKAKQTTTESGRFALLDSYFGKPSYSFGEKSLDNLLVQRGGGLDNAKQLRDQSTKLGAVAAQQGQQVQQMAGQRAADVDQSRIAARSAIGLDEQGNISGGALGSLQSEVEARAKAANETRDQTYQRLYEDLADNEWTPETMEALGLKAGDNLFGLSPRELLTKSADATAQTVATGDEYSRYQALAKLAGMDPSFLVDQSLAGTGGKNMVSIDADQFKTQLAGKQAEYEAAKQPFTQLRDQGLQTMQMAEAKIQAISSQLANPKLPGLDRMRLEAELKGFKDQKDAGNALYQQQQKKLSDLEQQFKAGPKVGRAKATVKPVEGGVR